MDPITVVKLAPNEYVCHGLRWNISLEALLEKLEKSWGDRPVLVRRATDGERAYWTRPPSICDACGCSHATGICPR